MLHVVNQAHHADYEHIARKKILVLEVFFKFKFMEVYPRIVRVSWRSPREGIYWHNCTVPHGSAYVEDSRTYAVSTGIF